jgi:hypothetical protein
MSGTYLPNAGIAEATAATQAAVAASQAASDARQADAGRFIRENGADVVGGHAMVGHAGDIGSDPDTGGMDESDQ